MRLSLLDESSEPSYFTLDFTARDSNVNPGISANSVSLKLYCSQTKLRRVPALVTALTEWVKSPWKYTSVFASGLICPTCFL